MKELARLDATAQAALCARGDLSSEELRAAAFARIAALNPLLRAVVSLADDARIESKNGLFRGVPLLLKDSLPWPGVRWSQGSRLFASNVAQQETAYGQHLRKAGFVCVGKSAMAELGLLASTETSLEGATHNPWNLAYSPAGSSGGSAVAVAAGLVPIAHASDGGGSLRNPASACGLFGFKPSRGHSANAQLGSSEFGDMTSDHCLTRSVRDSALFLSVTEQREAGDPVGFVRDPIARKLRVASWTRTLVGGEPEPSVREAHEKSLRLLEGLGHHVEIVERPKYQSELLRDAFYVVAGAAVSAIVELQDRRRAEPVQEAELEPFTWALVNDYLMRGPAALQIARAAFAEAARSYRESTTGYDVIVTPALATKPWLIGHLSPFLPRATLLERAAQSLGYAPIHNVTGCAAMSVPLFWSDDGLPLGTHFAATRGSDALLLGLAYQLEAAQPWQQRWPPFSYPVLFEGSR